jgi:hypothetical protein
VVQVVIMLAIGAAAGAASFTHVHDLAAAHRQGGWLAWADAIVLELMSVAAGLEIRRRRRHGAGLGMPSAVLGCAVTLSLSAQVVQAEHSIIGITAAAVPAIGFLTMVKIALGALGHQPHQPPEPPSAADEPAPTSPSSTVGSVYVASDRASPGQLPRHPQPGPDTDNADDLVPSGDRVLPERLDSLASVTAPPPGGSQPPEPTGRGVPVRNRTGTPGRLQAMVPAARQAATDLATGGEAVSRDRLAEILRERGYTLSNAQAGRLLTMLDVAAPVTAG